MQSAPGAPVQVFVVGLVILNASALGVSNAGKVDLKTVHVWIGYVFALNLGARLIWAFAGNRYARWRQSMAKLWEDRGTGFRYLLMPRRLLG